MRGTDSIETTIAEALLDRGFDAVVVVGPDGLVRWRRAGSLAPGGMPSAEAVGEMVLARIHPEDLPLVLTRMQELQEDSGARFDIDFRVRPTDGSAQWRRFVGVSFALSPGRAPYSIVLAGRFVPPDPDALDPAPSAYSLANVAPIALGVLSGDDHLVWCNTAMTELTGLTTGDLHQAAPGQEATVAEIARLAVLCRSGSRPHGTVEQSGRAIRVRARAIGEHTVSVMVSLEDVTAEVEAERARRTADRMFAAAFDHSPAGIAIVGLDGRFIRLNPAWTTITGYAPEALLGDHFAGITHSADLAADEAEVQDLLAGRRSSYVMEKRYLHADGGTIWVELHVALVSGDDGPHQFISTIVDITERRLMESALRADNATLAHQATHDWLTGLPNRAALAARLDTTLRDGHHPIVMVCDLDRFKAVNDAAGHAAGDAVLIELGRRMQELCRTDDLVARVGGDEFVIMAGPSPAAAAIDIAPWAQRFVDAIRRPVLVDGIAFEVGVSVGVTIAHPGEPAARTIARADALAYEIKAEGGGIRLDPAAQQVHAASTAASPPTPPHVDDERSDAGRGWVVGQVADRRRR